MLDRWIGAATRSLAAFVREEMGAYRLYTVVPRLVQFLENLTNVYVRLNRPRLRGQGNEPSDCHTALSTLFNVLLDTCKVSARPHQPFLQCLSLSCTCRHACLVACACMRLSATGSRLRNTPLSAHAAPRSALSVMQANHHASPGFIQPVPGLVWAVRR